MIFFLFPFKKRDDQLVLDDIGPVVGLDDHFFAHIHYRFSCDSFHHRFCSIIQQFLDDFQVLVFDSGPERSPGEAVLVVG